MNLPKMMESKGEALEQKAMASYERRGRRD